MFMQIAVTAIGIGIVLMVGYLIIAEVQNAIPAVRINEVNETYNETVYNITEDIGGTQSTVFAGFGLVAVGIIVLAAFGLISIFQ